MILFLSVAILMTGTIAGMRKSAEKQANAKKFKLLHRK
jgi:hypothetical protein